jgi:hypothetical protein
MRETATRRNSVSCFAENNERKVLKIKHGTAVEKRVSPATPIFKLFQMIFAKNYYF